MEVIHIGLFVIVFSWIIRGIGNIGIIFNQLRFSIIISFEFIWDKILNTIFQESGMKGSFHKGTSAWVKMGGARSVTLITGRNVNLFCKIICFIL